MTAFVLQIAALGVLSALGELALPEGTMRSAVRLVLSLVCSVVLAVTLTGLLRGRDAQAVTAQASQSWLRAAEVSQRQTDALARRQAVESAANQLSRTAERYCENAGYAARAVSYWTQEGELTRLELQLAAGDAPLMDEKSLLDRLCAQFGLDRARVMIASGAE